MIYILDTNIISLIFRFYYRERFPAFWENFYVLVLEGRAGSVSEVEEELKRAFGLESAVEELKRVQQGFFALPTSEEQQLIARIFDVPHFRTLINAKAVEKGTPVADLFIIAKAGVSLNTSCVVTQEVWSPNAAKIPNVCDYFNIDCINLEQLMEREGWQF